MGLMTQISTAPDGKALASRITCRTRPLSFPGSPGVASLGLAATRKILHFPKDGLGLMQNLSR